jgi:L-ascorbate metabolism protein UlaG (beta-lactamase superfamily)
MEFFFWLAWRKPGPWRRWTEAPFGAPPPRRVFRGELRVTFVGHSSILIQMDALNILCDPHWSERASPFAKFGPRRHRAPGVRFEDLPPIDLVLLSHDHYDHLDAPTLRRIAAEWHPDFIVPLGVRSVLAANDVEGAATATELDWWQMVATTPEIRITAVPARHSSGRTFFDRNKTLWCGYVIEGPAGTVFLAGDTAYGPHFLEIKKRFSPIGLAFLPIGSFLPRSLMQASHMSPSEAVRAHIDLGTKSSIGIHFGTFRLADDAEDEPVKELQRILAEAENPKPDFYTLAPGEGRDIMWNST